MTTTSMQFGQQAISVVLNEGQLPAKLSTVNGNTVLVGPVYPAIIVPRRAEQYGTKPDGVALYDATTSNSKTSIIQSASGAFTSADIGKVCAVHTRVSTAALANARFGTIVSVQSPTQCTTSLNLAPGSLTDAMFVYGTDNAVPLQAAVTAAVGTRDKVLKLPAGIICSSAQITVNGNIVIEGAGRSYTELGWFDFDYAGTSLVMCGFSPDAALYCPGNITGPRLYSFNIDAMGILQHALNIAGRAAHVSDMTVLKPVGGANNTHALKMGPGMMLDHCTLIGGFNCYPLATGGDSQVSHCNIYGIGATYYGIRVNGTNDIIIADNHIWPLASGLFAGGSIHVNAWKPDMNSVLIHGNQLDTAVGQPHIKVDVAAGSALRGLNISNNSSFNNDNVSGHDPWLSINTGAASDLRGLSIHGNTANTSWGNATLGAHSCLIDGSGITAGTIHGSIVDGNYIDRPTVGGYVSFTPDVSTGNIQTANDGTVTTF